MLSTSYAHPRTGYADSGQVCAGFGLLTVLFLRVARLSVWSFNFCTALHNLKVAYLVACDVQAV